MTACDLFSGASKVVQQVRSTQPYNVVLVLGNDVLFRQCLLLFPMLLDFDELKFACRQVVTSRTRSRP